MKSIFLVLFLCGASLGQTATLDMLDWMTMDSFGSYTKGTGAAMWTVMDSAQSQFYWVKNSKGYPWDVKKYDANFIYDTITEINLDRSQGLQETPRPKRQGLSTESAICALRSRLAGQESVHHPDSAFRHKIRNPLQLFELHGIELGLREN